MNKAITDVVEKAGMAALILATYVFLSTPPPEHWLGFLVLIMQILLLVGFMIQAAITFFAWKQLKKLLLAEEQERVN